MTITDLVYHRALAMLWSAGHAPSRSQRVSMQCAAMRHSPGPNWPLDQQLMTDAACALLATFGYAPDASKPYDEALPEVTIMHRHSPAPGHAVRIVGDGGWMGVKQGEILTLSSTDERGRLKIGSGRHYLTEDGAVSLSSGGPGSIGGLRTDVLGRTDETMRRRFWRFHLSPEANGGVDFTRPVPVWTWDGDGAAFDHEEEIQTCR